MQNPNVMFCGWNVVICGTVCAPMMLQPTHKPQSSRTYIMYHGTSVASARLIIANGFKPSKDGLLGPGVYVSRDLHKASKYPLNSNRSDRVVLQVHVRVGRVKRIDRDNHPMMKTWHAYGFNSAWVPPNAHMRSVPSGMEEDCIYNPKRVKVVGIAVAPNASIKAELQRLLTKKLSKKKAQGHIGRSAPVVYNACGVCTGEVDQDAPHIKQMCWNCGQDICTFMTEHECLPEP